MKRPIPLLAFTLAAIMLTAGCQTVETISNVAADAAAELGAITPEQQDSIKKTTTSIIKAFDSITPEQEYYIGRTVGAMILSQYKPYDNPAATQYLNTLGQSIARASDRPETHGGYHFLILDTDEINAFAAPGGLIFISRGMLRCCRNEDALAAVLAHEIGHVACKHGLQAISKSRFTSAGMTLLSETAKSLGPRELAEITKTFEGSVNDITATLINSGYARRLESAADAAAVKTLRTIGYDPKGLEDVLTQVAAHSSGAEKTGLAKTHPDPGDRIREIKELIGQSPDAPSPAQRQARFQQALGVSML